MSSFLVEEMSGREFEEGDFQLAIVPVGSTENHGNHLPFAQDTYVAYELSKRVAKRVKNALVLPPLYFGMSEHHKHTPFFVSIRPQNLINVLTDIFESIYQNGIKRVIVINGHDGNIAPLEIAGRMFKVSHPDVVVAVLGRWWELVGELLPKGTFEVDNGLGHGGEGEVSIALNLFPHLVEMREARGVVPILPRHLDIKWTFSELTPHGATGDPTKGTSEKGEMMVESLVNAVVEFIEEMERGNWSYGWNRGLEKTSSR